MITPNGRSLPHRSVDGAKVYHLVAEPVRNVFCPGLAAECWGYNGGTPGPTIEATEGDRLRIYVTNRLPEPTSVHWHGIRLPNGMDGVSGLNQTRIEVGKTFRYEFVVPDAGTFMYHPHFDEMVQLAMGLQGMLIVHPRRATRLAPDRDFAIMLSEWSIPAGAARPNVLEMSDFNVLTMNSKAFPGTEPLVVAQGERVRIRFGNLSTSSHHPIHLHGHHFEVVETDGGVVPPSARTPLSTVLVPTGSTRAIELIADNPGDWALHCHMTHHMMNQMGHASPHAVGADAERLRRSVGRVVPGYMPMGANGMGEMSEMEMPYPDNSVPMLGARGQFGTIDMGGMVTVFKVRRELPRDGEEVGWYSMPRGTLAREATNDELASDGIEVGEPVEAPSGHGDHSNH
ncbi:MAG: copper oxidase [Polyangiaceae bacterium]|nr:copper oxidase [Polyangiaceae bacterium]